MDQWTFGHVDVWMFGWVDLWTCAHPDVLTCRSMEKWTTGGVEVMVIFKAMVHCIWMVIQNRFCLLPACVIYMRYKIILPLLCTRTELIGWRKLWSSTDGERIFRLFQQIWLSNCTWPFQRILRNWGAKKLVYNLQRDSDPCIPATMGRPTNTTVTRSFFRRKQATNIFPFTSIGGFLEW